MLLGSNLNDRFGSLKAARVAISNKIGSIQAESAIYESEPWGFQANHQFLNQVVKVKTGLDPFQIMDEIFRIEKEMGRVRIPENGYISRTIDIDILFYNDEIIKDDNLVIPHPKLQERMFTLVPLSELDISFIHPSFRKSIGQLKEECLDTIPVFPYQPEASK